jgi:hypothetical protein
MKGFHLKSSWLVTRLSPFVSRHRWGLAVGFFILFFLLTFAVSVSGGLRVFVPYLGELTGFPLGQKNYLVIFQNNNELRPAGGFISSFGTVQFTAGLPTKIQIEDVYGAIDEHPYQTPPWPMEKLLANQWYKGYTFRDGNYSPDFPATARELLRLYSLTRPNEKINGVVAVNFRVLEDLLDALGPVQVEGKWLSKDNLFEELTNQVNDVDRHNVESLANRKSILRPLADAIIKKILTNPFKLRKVSDVITRSMSKKDLQLFFFNQNLQKLVEKNGWAGEWPEQVSGDFLAVNEANLGGMKSDRYLNRHFTYHVRFSEEYFTGDASPSADLTLDLTHFGIENIPLSGPYTGYFRVFSRPEQVKTAFATDAPAASADRPLDEIIKLNPGESRTVKKTWALSRDVLKDKVYTLDIPKQSGTDTDLYSIIIELPRGYRVESDDFEARENLAFWQGTLSRDITLKLKVLDDQTPPRVVLQENTELNHFAIHFNEDLNQNFASDPFSYEVKDLNIQNPGITDQLTIRKVETTSKDIDIYLTGQTVQPEERYGIRLKNLRDIHGNVLSNREITVVQRLKK